MQICFLRTFTALILFPYFIFRGTLHLTSKKDKNLTILTDQSKSVLKDDSNQGILNVFFQLIYHYKSNVPKQVYFQISFEKDNSSLCIVHQIIFISYFRKIHDWRPTDNGNGGNTKCLKKEQKEIDARVPRAIQLNKK